MNKAKQEAERLVERLVSELVATIEVKTLGNDCDYQIQNWNELGKQCALICVEREYAGRIDELAKISEYLPEDIHFQAHFSLKKEYQQVKQAIQEL